MSRCAVTTRTRGIGEGVLGEVLAERLKAEKLGSHRKEGLGLKKGGQWADKVPEPGFEPAGLALEYTSQVGALVSLSLCVRLQAGDSHLGCMLESPGSFDSAQ